ncbi:hypothetical protein [Oceanicaulis sp.]|uniref:hypothetical protein n=1 Tax=Oceanicaulis sp. TaxID=1924941 RepID=UPI003F6F19CF
MTNPDHPNAASQSETASSARPGDEMLPFLNNFHDIFTTIGVLILFTGLFVGAVQFHDSLNLDQQSVAAESVSLLLLGLIALIAWGLSAILVGRQRRILPGIVLCVVFVGCCGTFLAWLYTSYVMPALTNVDPQTAFDHLSVFNQESVRALLNELDWVLRTWPVIIAAVFVVATAIYYLSFRLPFSGGLLGVALVNLAVCAWLVIDPYSLVVFNPLAGLLMGLTLFFAGVIFDARDPARTTRLSGTGFWLHFFAAPVLLSAAITMALNGVRIDPQAEGVAGMIYFPQGGEDGAAVRAAIVTLMVIAVFALVSLLINRRALIVSGLLTTGVALGVLVNQLGLDGAGVVATTLLVLGGIVVLLGVAWTPVRRVLTAPFPNEGVIARIIPSPVHGHEG